jgi:8-hydroxy-5-deazaflavin:NADPH oxidoreductase
MRFGIIGAGNIGRAVARHAVAAGHDVIIASRRGGESLAAAAAEVGATPGTVAEAASGELVLLAVPWAAVPDALDGLTWDGQVLIDATNAFISFSPMRVEDFGDGTSSERVASLAPGARVVKAFNTLYARMIAADPRHAEGRQLVFFAGDDADAKTRFAEVVEAFGFATLDVGTLHDGGRLLSVGGGPLAGFHALKQDV